MLYIVRGYRYFLKCFEMSIVTKRLFKRFYVKYEFFNKVGEKVEFKKFVLIIF